MGMEIIIGGSGTGKSRWIYKELSQYRANLVREVCLIVPEQFTLEAEQEYMQLMEEKGIFGFEVTSFQHLMQQVVQRYQPSARYWMNDLGKVLLLDHVLDSFKEEFGVLRRLKGKPRLLQEFYRDLIDGKWQSDQIQQVIADSESADVDLSQKLTALHQLLLHYEAELAKEGLVDEVVYVQIVCELLRIHRPYEGAVIYLDQFWGFSMLEMEVLAVLNEQAEAITVAMTMEYLNDASLFAQVRQTVDSLLQRFPEAVEIELPAEDVMSVPFHSLNLSWIEEPSNLELSQNQVSIYSALNREEEVRFCASKMTEWKAAGVPFQEMQVVVSDSLTYLPLIRSVFRQSGIPVHLDYNRKISDYPAAQAVLNYMRFQDKKHYEDLLAAMKTGYFDIRSSEIDRFERSVKQRGWQFYQEWQQALLAQEMREADSCILRLISEGRKRRREKSVEKHWQSLCETLKSAKYYTQFQQRDKRLDSEAVRLEHQSIWRGFESVIDQMIAMHEEKPIAAKTFRDQFTLGCELIRVGVLPAVDGEAIVREFFRSRSTEKRCTVFLGMNEGKFPAVDQPSGFFDFEEREWLAEREVAIGNTRNFQIQMQNLALYQIIAKTKEQLIFVWSRRDRNFEVLSASGILENFAQGENVMSHVVSWKDLLGTPWETKRFCRQILRKLADGASVSEEQKKVAERIYLGLDSDQQHEIIMLLNYGNQVHPLKSDLAEALYSREETSITELERHNQCPFAHFIEYGLEPQELKPYRIEEPDVGQVMHDLMELGYQAYCENRLHLTRLREVFSEISAPYFASYREGLFQKNKTNQYIERQIFSSILASLRQLMIQKESSQFQTVGQEIRFDRLQDSLEPIQIRLREGKSISVCGRIDRIDEFEDEGEHYLQVIDYKSGRSPIDWQEMMNGIQMQLPTYLNVCMLNRTNETKVASGLFHYYLDRPLPTLDSGTGLNEQIRDFYRMRGYVLSNPKVIIGMDKEILDTGLSKSVFARMKKDGSLGKSSQMIAAKEMENLLSKNLACINETVREIYQGKIRFEPYCGKDALACETCSLGAICQFDPNFEDNKPRELTYKGGGDHEVD